MTDIGKIGWSAGASRLRYKIVIALSAFFIIGALPVAGQQATLPNSTAVPLVPDNDALRHAPTNAYPGGVWRVDSARRNGAPPLFYVPQNGTCAANGMENDGGNCIDTTSNDGNSWKAQFADTGRIDVRAFGAVADDLTPADGAVAAAIAYAESVHGCTYIPDLYPGFLLQSSIKIAADACLVGGRIKGWVVGDRPFPSYPPSNLHFVNDTDGIDGPGGGAGPHNCYIANLSLVGHAAQSTVVTHTAGLNIKGLVDCKIENVFISNFVVCRQMTGPASRMIIRDIWCNNQQAYPNLVNDFPYACIEMDQGARSAVAADQMTGDVCREQSWTTLARSAGDGARTYFDISKPRAGISLWRADGIKVRVGPHTKLPNGQVVFDAPLKSCGMGGGDGDYTVWDISAGGGDGSGGTQLFCTHTMATVTGGTPRITVPSTAGYKAGSNILAFADHGLPLATKVASIDDARHLTLTKAPYVTGNLRITLTQANIRAAGQGGAKIEVRLKTAPPAGRNNVEISWIDPTGYAAYYITGASDYLFIRPLMVGGYDVALKHTGLTDGGVTFEPTYIELLNQCADIEKATYGDVAIFHRIINPPIPDCPGYVDPEAGPTIIAFNNVYHFYNGANTIAMPQPSGRGREER